MILQLLGRVESLEQSQDSLEAKLKPLPFNRQPTFIHTNGPSTTFSVSVYVWEDVWTQHGTIPVHFGEVDKPLATLLNHIGSQLDDQPYRKTSIAFQLVHHRLDASDSRRYIERAADNLNETERVELLYAFDTPIRHIRWV